MFPLNLVPTPKIRSLDFFYGGHSLDYLTLLITNNGCDNVLNVTRPTFIWQEHVPIMTLEK
jgi:hypothetical protein